MPLCPIQTLLIPGVTEEGSVPGAAASVLQSSDSVPQHHLWHILPGFIFLDIVSVNMGCFN